MNYKKYIALGLLFAVFIDSKFDYSSIALAIISLTLLWKS